MPNRRSSIKAALRTNRELGNLFAQLGTAEHPRGAVLMAYRNARRALRDVLRRNTLARVLEAHEVMTGLKDSVRMTADTTLAAAIDLGWEQAQVEARVWELEPLMPYIDTMAMADAWIGIIEQQERGILATLATASADPAPILGDGITNGGMLGYGNLVTREGARWLATAAGLALIGALQPAMEGSGRAWGKQAIAAIDDRTTECCLGVHGQVVPEKKQFHTAGTPAWAAYQDWTPFHWNCRTSVGLVPMDEADDDLTAMLLEQSAGEKEKRRDARLRIAEIQEALVGKKTIPDARRRADDTAAITELREELLALRQRGGYATGG